MMPASSEGSDPANTAGTADYNDYAGDTIEQPWVNNTNVYIRAENVGTDYYKLYLSMDYSQEDLLSHLHLRYGVETKDVRALFRIRLFGNGHLIDSDEFYVKIWGTGETYEGCASAYAVKRGESNDQTLAFTAGQSYANLTMHHALQADIKGLDATT